MSFDTTTWLIIGGIALALVLIALLFLRGRRQKVITRETHDRDNPYVAKAERAYVSQDATNKAPPPIAPALVVAPEPVAEPVLREPEPDAPSQIAPPPLPIAGEIVGIAMPPHATDAPDVLTQLKGVGPKLAALLNDQGISRFDQLAHLTDEDRDALDAQLGAFAGRLKRDRVVEQARYLAAGDTVGFEAVFGKLGG